MARAEEAPERVFTAEELSHYDGVEGRPAYVAYNGLVYDVSESPEFPEGDHYGYMAGEDHTDIMDEAPHEDDVLEQFPVIGRFEGR